MNTRAFASLLRQFEQTDSNEEKARVADLFFHLAKAALPASSPETGDLGECLRSYLAFARVAVRGVIDPGQDPKAFDRTLAVMAEMWMSFRVYGSKETTLAQVKSATAPTALHPPPTQANPICTALWEYRTLETSHKLHQFTELIIDQLGPRLHRLISSYLRCPADAEDVLQITFARIFEILHKFTGTADSQFREFCWAVGRYAVKEHIRRTSKQPKTLSDPEEVAKRLDKLALDNTESEDVRTAALDVETLMGCVSAQQDVFLRDKYLDGLRINEIARKHGVSSEKVKKALYRAKQRIQAHIKNTFGDYGKKLE